MMWKVYFIFSSLCYASLLALDLECEYEIIDNFYACVPTQRNFVYTKTDKIIKVNGTHMANHTISQVGAIISNYVNFSYLPNGFGKSFDHLEVFKIEQAGLMNVIGTDVDFMTRVAEVSFHENFLVSIHPDLFNGMEGLERLRLSGNRIKVLSDQLFALRSRLKEFYIDRNSIEILPKNIFKENGKLLRLSMKDNLLKRINVDFMDLKDLNQIYFDNNTCTNQTFFIQVMTMYEFQKRIRETCFDKKIIEDRQPEFD